MPTRIILNETVAAASPSSRPPSTQSQGLSSARLRPSFSGSHPHHADDIETPRSPISSPTIEPRQPPPSTSPASNNGNGKKRKKARKVVSLQSSLFPAITKEENAIHWLSRDDIRASPRLLGYMYQLLASTVMLISVLKFYFEDEGNSETTPAVWSLFKLEREGASLRDDLFITLAGPVFTWKLIGCFVVSGLGTAINVLIILTHFDTVCFPSLWLRIFRDGSRYEQIILYSMVLFWAGGLHINTSSLSVGESNANIFFTTWVSFFAAFLNGGVWRVSAGRMSIAEFVNHHHRKTTYNWLWMFMFACTCAGAMTGTYLNRDYVSLYFEGQSIRLTQQQWMIALSILWGLAAVCCVAIFLNHVLEKSCEWRTYHNRLVVIGWRQLEGLVALAIAGEC
jgi:hypothetical protein